MTRLFGPFLTLATVLLASPSWAWVRSSPSQSVAWNVGQQQSKRTCCGRETSHSSLGAQLDPSESSSASADTSLSFLSTSDLARLSAMRSRHVTMPILILDAMLPGQRLEFGTSDPKFRRLIDAVLLAKNNHHDSHEIGMIGMNPHTGRPLNIGVTLKLSSDSVSVNRHDLTTIQVQATHRRFEVQGEPWLDDTESFYYANVELVEDRPEPALSEELNEQADALMGALPSLVEEWLQWVLQSGKSTPQGMAGRMEDIGRMPDGRTERALWVAALVNPIPALGVCLEVRPAMLACKNDFDRLYLASAALQSSIDHMSGVKRLF